MACCMACRSIRSRGCNMRSRAREAGKDIALVHYDVEALVILQGEKPPCA
jgi:hypothetical protein